MKPSRRGGAVKASDIPDMDVLRFIEEARHLAYPFADRDSYASWDDVPKVPVSESTYGWKLDPHWVLIWEIELRFKQFPPKVVAAKLKALVRRGLLDGCTCGCRGDYELTYDGEVRLGLIPEVVHQAK